MTLIDCINRIDNEKPNEYTTEQKINWINVVELSVLTELLNTGFAPYTINDDQTAVLYVPDPYSEIYVDYAKGMIDLNNEDYDSYNAIMIRYNSIYQRYADFISRHAESSRNFKNFM